VPYLAGPAAGEVDGVGQFILEKWHRDKTENITHV
jgi:hypothetical protein